MAHGELDSAGTAGSRWVPQSETSFDVIPDEEREFMWCHSLV